MKTMNANVRNRIGRVPLLLLFWDAEAEEGFAPQAHWLFDASVTHYLDLEAMLFLVEHLMERLMEG